MFSRGHFKTNHRSTSKEFAPDLRQKCSQPLRRVQGLCAWTAMHNHCDMSKDFAPAVCLD